MAVGLGVAAHTERAIATDTFAVKVHQGEYTALLGNFAVVNAAFAFLFLLVSLGTVAGFANENGESEKKQK